MQWFLNLMEELGIECQVGHPAKIRAAEPRKQKYDRRDADLILKLLAENRFPSIWLPSRELVDLRALLLHRHQWVRLRTRVQNALQAIALAHGLRRGPSLWSKRGQDLLASLPLGPHTAHRRSTLKGLGRAGWQQLANSGSGCGSCCGMELTIRSSVVADRCVRRTVKPVWGCLRCVMAQNSRRLSD
jgi:hypothetical protein